jgi:hypothetical protein
VIQAILNFVSQYSARGKLPEKVCGNSRVTSSFALFFSVKVHPNPLK